MHKQSTDTLESHYRWCALALFDWEHRLLALYAHVGLQTYTSAGTVQIGGAYLVSGARRLKVVRSSAASMINDIVGNTYAVAACTLSLILGRPVNVLGWDLVDVLDGGFVNVLDGSLVNVLRSSLFDGLRRGLLNLF